VAGTALPLVAEASEEAEDVVVASLSQAGESAEMIAAAKPKPEPRTASVAPVKPASAVERNAADWLQVPAEEAVAARFERSAAVAPAPSSALAEPETSGWQAFVVPEEAGPEALRTAATDGDPRALLEIGNRYAQGMGVEEDLEAAASWYELAAELGLAPAQYRIANMYEKGIGVERDLEKARSFYEMAAEQGNASAMHNLAVLHAMGADGAADNRSAVRWFTQAADLGVRDSQFNLGILTAKGVGTQQNLIEAYKWFDIVAREGDEDAAGKREEVASLLEPEQLERAKATAQLWQVRPLDQAANTVDVPAEWREDVQSTASIDMQAVLRNVQAILNANGYQAGTPDGIMGQRTRTAISAFQKDNDLPQTGEVDEQLISLLLERR
jgi:localization factor PodJL